MSRRVLRVTGLARVGMVMVAGALAGCAGSANGGPMALTPASSASCKSMKVEMNRLLASGVQGSIEARQAGRKVSAASGQRADRYNALLNQYIGSRCHE